MGRGKIVVLLFGLVFLLCVNVAWADTKVMLDGKQMSFDVPPAVENGRTLVPVRAIFEALGASIYWDPNTQTITSQSSGKDREINITIGNRQAYVNNVPVELDVPASIIGNRTMVPLRFVSEALGANVSWDGKAQTIAITSIAAKKAATPTVRSNGQELPVLEVTVAGKVIGWYTGALKDGVPNGKGGFLAQDGSEYTGDFKDGKAEGVGVITFTDGSVYKGQVSNFVRNGQGEMTYKSGKAYKGTFTNGAVTGTGTITVPGGLTYIGDVVNGVPEGQGKTISASGEVVVGKFKAGEFVSN